jgi:ribosome biogenesis GTPase
VVLDSGGLLLDTPGLRELALMDDGEGLDQAFADVGSLFESLARECRFRDCRHAGEPGCAVARALDAGALDAGRLASYRKLARERERLAARTDLHARLERTRQIRRFQKIVRSATRRPK